MTKPLPGQLNFDGVVYRGDPRVLAFADLHLGNYRFPIRPHIIEAMKEIVIMAGKMKPNVILFAGDAFRHAVPSAADVDAFGGMVRDLSRIAEIIMIPGNHDLAGGKSTTLDVYNKFDNVTVVKEPKILQREDFQVCCIPWLPQKALRTIGLDASNNSGAIRALMSLLKATLNPDKFSILLGHLTTLGTEYREGASTVLGSDVLWTSDMFEGFDLSILGHIHGYKEVYPNVFYVGSPCPVSFGEEGQDKYVFGWLDSHSYLYRPKAPIFITIGANDTPRDFFVPDCFLKIVKEHDEPDPDTSTISCEWLEIVSLPPERDFRQRLEEAQEMSPEDVLVAWCELEGYNPEPILKLAGELMEVEKCSA